MPELGTTEGWQDRSTALREQAAALLAEAGHLDRAIAEAENITVRPEEVNAEYRRLSVQQDTPEADIRRVLAPETVAAALAAQKVQRFLLDNAVVTSVMDPDKE